MMILHVQNLFEKYTTIFLPAYDKEWELDAVCFCIAGVHKFKWSKY